MELLQMFDSMWIGRDFMDSKGLPWFVVSVGSAYVIISDGKVIDRMLRADFDAMVKRYRAGDTGELPTTAAPDKPAGGVRG